MPSGRTRDPTFAAAGTAVYGLLVLVGMRLHEPWRDEVQAWMLSASVGAPWELFEILRYEGHPALWYLVLWPVTRLTTELWALQLVHGAIAVAGAYLVLAHAPFPRWQRALLLAGYLFGYEWALVARAYGPGAVLVFLFLATLRDGRPRPLWHGGLLALLANTSAYGAIVAGGLTLGWLALGPLRTGGGARTALGVGVVAVGLALATWTARPPPRNAFQGDPTTDGGISAAWALSAAAYTVVPAYAPIPLEQDGIRSDRTVPWASTRGLLAAGAGLALGLVVVLGIGLASRPAAALVFLSTTAVLMLFALAVHAGGIRHHGHYVLALVAGVWLWRALPPDRRLLRRVRAERLGDLAERVLPITFTIVLVLQAVGGIAVWTTDISRPYSGAEVVASTLEEIEGDEPVAVTRSMQAPGIAARLGREVFLLDRGVWSTWADRRLPARPFDREVELLTALEPVVPPGGSGLVVSERALADVPTGWSVEPLLHVDRAILPNERLHLSRIVRPLRP